MIDSILLVSNNKDLSKTCVDKVVDLVNLIAESNKQVHIFKEDIQLYKILKNYSNVYYLDGLSSKADTLLFNRINPGIYNKEDSIRKARVDCSNEHKKSISRNIVRDRSKFYDKTEYDTFREAVVYRRLKYVISSVAERYQFIIHFKNTKESNIINMITPTFGDGKFLYSYDCSTHKSEFTVGGCFLGEEQFIRCIKEEI